MPKHIGCIPCTVLRWLSKFKIQMLAYGLAMLLLWLTVVASAHAGEEVTVNCLKLQAPKAEHLLSEASIETAQRHLLELGFHVEKVDGVLGPKTRHAVAEYCKVDKIHFNWPVTIQSSEFQKWQSQQDAQNTIDQNLRSGESSRIIPELDNFFSWRNHLPLGWKDESVVSYRLDKKDWEALKAGGGIFRQVGELLGKSYATEGEFRTALQVALNGMDEADLYLDSVTLEEQAGLQLSEASLKSLKVAKVPEHVLQALFALQDLTYPDEQLNEEVSKVLAGLAEKMQALKPEVIKLAEITPNGAQFTEAGLKKFAAAHVNDPLAAAVLARLQFMKTVIYQSDKTVGTAVNNVFNLLVAEMNDSLPTILDNAEIVVSYQPSAQSVQLLNQQMGNKVIPEIYLVLLQSLQGVEYPNAELFWQSALMRVGLTGIHYPTWVKITNVLRQHRATTLNETLLSELKKQQIHPLVLVQLKSLVDHKFGSTAVLEKEILAIFTQLAKDFEAFRPLLLAQAKKAYLFDPSKHVLWSGGGCSCVMSHLSGQVYGLYPFWQAGEKQLINFSAQTRIGFYALNFDDKGHVTNADKWLQMNDDFIHEARRYDTRVDLVLQRSNWDSWNYLSVLEKQQAFENLAGQISALLKPKADFFSQIQAQLSFGAPGRADGVTLYFDGYPQDKDSLDAFKSLMRLLRNKLDEDQAIHVMLRSAEMGQGIYQYGNLLDTIALIKTNDVESSGHLLVLLQEPTSIDKKQLRIQIENGLDGENRMKLLRNITTVVSYDGQNADQLKDDIIYAEDNFGGIGFWPQTLNTPAGQAVTKALLTDYLNESVAQPGVLKSICGVVCPNKWPFRIAFSIALLLLATCTVMYFRVCSWRVFLERHFVRYLLIVVMPTILLGLSLLFCDPVLDDISRGNAPLIMMIVVAVAYLIWNYYHNQSKDNLP